MLLYLLNMSKDSEPAKASSIQEAIKSHGFDSVDDYLDSLSRSDEDAIEKLGGANPHAAVLVSFPDIRKVFADKEKSRKEIDDTNTEEYSRWHLANLSLRIAEPSNIDYDIAEYRYVNYLVDILVLAKFDDDLNKFDIDQLESKDYGDLVDEIAEVLWENKDEVSGFGTSDKDPEIIAFISRVCGISSLALASGSRKTYAKAEDHLRKLQKAYLGYELPAVAEVGDMDDKDYAKLQRLRYKRDFSAHNFREDSFLAIFLSDLYSNKRKFEDLLNYKEAVGDDWQGLVDKYCIEAITQINRGILKGSNPQNNRASAKKVAELTRKRLMIHKDFILIDDYFDETEETKEVEDTNEGLLESSEMYVELDWTVLPDDEGELVRQAKDIVQQIEARSEETGRKADIDLDRLNILRNIRESWGKDRCYYARGTLGNRPKVKIAGQEYPDEYIVLVLQDINGDGGILTEHAIAESPVVGPNAMYVFRSDVSQGYSWRQVYSLPKKQARALGARRVKHTTSNGRSIVEELTDKATCLLTATPEEFEKVKFSSGRIYLARSAGHLALK
jgi:hypothetical protein